MCCVGVCVCANKLFKLKHVVPTTVRLGFLRHTPIRILPSVSALAHATISKPFSIAKYDVVSMMEGDENGGDVNGIWKEVEEVNLVS